MAKAGSELVGGSKNDEIGTPPALFKELNEQFQFDYDPAASHLNHLDVRHYSTKEGTFSSALGLISPEDGLTWSWGGKRVFINPPYSTPLFRLFIQKMIEERNSAAIIVGLVKWDTSTLNAKRLAEFAHIQPLRRVRYQGMASPATFASAIVIMKKDWRGYAR